MDQGKKMDKSERMEAARQAWISATGKAIENLEKDLERNRGTFPEPVTLIFAEALCKYHQGVAKHGAFDSATDTRDLLKEAEAEILDAINYLAMYLLKVRAKRRRESEEGVKGET